jgi:hypothetical protein
VLNVRVNVKGAVCCPESQRKSGTQLLALHVPEVVVWVAESQSHSTVVPTVIVVVELPLKGSKKEMLPPCPMFTM